MSPASAQRRRRGLNLIPKENVAFAAPLDQALPASFASAASVSPVREGARKGEEKPLFHKFFSRESRVEAAGPRQRPCSRTRGDADVSAWRGLAAPKHPRSSQTSAPIPPVISQGLEEAPRPNSHRAMRGRTPRRQQRGRTGGDPRAPRCSPAFRGPRLGMRTVSRGASGCKWRSSASSPRGWGPWGTQPGMLPGSRRCSHPARMRPNRLCLHLPADTRARVPRRCVPRRVAAQPGQPCPCGTRASPARPLPTSPAPRPPVPGKCPGW